MSFRIEKTANYRTRCVATNPRPACFSSQESQINNALDKNLIYVPDGTVILNVDDINRGNAHYLVEGNATVIVPTTELLDKISFEMSVLSGTATLNAPDALDHFYVNNQLPANSTTLTVIAAGNPATYPPSPDSNDINHPHKFVYKVSGDQPLPTPTNPLIYPAWFKVL